MTDPAVLAAALLHDTIEDTETTPKELRGQFGVAAIVEEVTDIKWLKKRARKKLQVARAGRSSKGAKLIKLADKIGNVREVLANPPADWTLDRRREYSTGRRAWWIRCEEPIRSWCGGSISSIGSGRDLQRKGPVGPAPPSASLSAGRD